MRHIQTLSCERLTSRPSSLSWGHQSSTSWEIRKLSSGCSEDSLSRSFLLLLTASSLIRVAARPMLPQEALVSHSSPSTSFATSKFFVIRRLSTSGSRGWNLKTWQRDTIVLGSRRREVVVSRITTPGGGSSRVLSRQLAASTLIFSASSITKTLRLDSTGLRDRKSTRLNSSHSSISYAVFPLKN